MVSRLWLCLLLIAAGCLPDAEARPGAGHRNSRRTGNHASASGGAADAGFDIFAQYSAAAGQPAWTIEINGSAFPDPASASAGIPHAVNGADAGALAWSQGADAGTYTRAQSTGSLTPGGLGSGFVDTAVVINGSGSCWTLASSALPAIPDGEDAWCRLIFATGDNTTTRYELSLGNAANDLFGLSHSSTERQITTLRTGGLTILNAQTAVLATGTVPTHMVDYYLHGANPTNPSADVFADGTATIGAEHSANLGSMAANQRITIGGTTAGQCTNLAINNVFTIVRMACKFGNTAIGGVTVNEALHDADCTRVGVCP